MNLEKRIKDNYNLDIIDITKNEDSSDGNVYNIKTSNNKYIIKIYNDKAKAETMVNLHNSLNKLYIPKIIMTKNKKYLLEVDNKFIVVYSFLEGKQISKYIKENNGEYSEKVIKLIAKALRKFHDLTLNQKYNLQVIDFANNLERQSVLHFDLTKENIFINDNTIGFIDFDDAKYGDSVCDVGILLSFLFVSKTRGVDKNSINIFLNNYYENEDELKSKELKFISEYINNWVDYIQNGHEFDSSLKDSFEFKKSNAENIIGI